MRDRNPSVLWTLAVLLVASIATAVTPAPAAAQRLADSTGSYRFEARSGKTIVAQGTFTVTADSVTVDAIPGPCNPSVTASTSLAIKYQCGNVVLAFHRIRPLTQSTAAGTVTVTEMTETCLVSSTNANGQTVCVRRGNESARRDVPVVAMIRVVRD